MKVYSIAIGNLPMKPKELKKIGEYLKKLDGFKALHPMYPKGTILVFDTYGHTLEAKNLMTYDGITCGTYIMECELDDKMQNLEVIGVAKEMGVEINEQR